VDALLNQLNVAAQHNKQNQTPQARLEQMLSGARRTLLGLQASMSNMLAAAAARDPPPASRLDDELARYIREIVERVKPVQAAVGLIAPLKFAHEQFATAVDSLCRAILHELHYLLAQRDREEIASLADELVRKALELVESIGRASVFHQGDDTDGSMTAAQNQFVATLQRLIQAITGSAKNQIQTAASERNAAQRLAEAVQEAAVYAQSVAELLKQPLFEPQAFKNNLTSMISAVKKTAQAIDDPDTKEAIMLNTRHVLEASLKLQQSHEAGEVQHSSSHLDVLNAITTLLRSMMALIRSP
jgi:hypothetical protein